MTGAASREMRSIGVPPVFCSRRPPQRCQAQDKEGCSSFAASFGLPTRSHPESGSARPLSRSKAAPRDTQARRLLLLN